MRKITSILFLFCTLELIAQTPEDLFLEGNAHYENEHYDLALGSYEQALESVRSVGLYYNAGNAAYKSGLLGRAILYYERALTISPTAEDVLANLEIANSRVADRIEALPSLGVDTIWSVLTAENKLSLWVALTILLQCVGLGLLTWRFFVDKKEFKGTLFTAGALFVFIGFVTLGLYSSTVSALEKSTGAIIMVPVVEVKNAPTVSSQEAYVLHEGTKVEILSSSNDWVEIKIANGSIGWIETAALEAI